MKARSRKLIACTAASAAFATMVPSLAFAEEGGAAGVTAILPVMDEFIPMLVAFIILLIVLGKFGWPKFEEILEKRKTTIQTDLEKAEQARIEAERLLEANKAQMDEVKTRAAEIIADAKKAGEAVKADITEQAQAEAQAMIAKANAAIEAEKKAAIAELKESVASLSVSVAGKVIGEDLSDEEHLKMIERYIAEAGSIDAN